MPYGSCMCVVFLLAPFVSLFSLIFFLLMVCVSMCVCVYFLIALSVLRWYSLLFLSHPLGLPSFHLGAFLSLLFPLRPLAHTPYVVQVLVRVIIHTLSIQVPLLKNAKRSIISISFFVGEPVGGKKLLRPYKMRQSSATEINFRLGDHLVARRHAFSSFILCKI